MKRIYTLVALLVAVMITSDMAARTTTAKVVEDVALTPYLPKPTSASSEGMPAVIVCAGGSYFWHDRHREGVEVAEWLQQHGIAAFILDYRTAYVPAYLFHFRLFLRGNRFPDAQNDLRRALGHLRSHAHDYGINPGAIGVMGFSAGGHLALWGGECLPHDERPAFVAAIYPVVTMREPCTHRRSRRGLMGESQIRNQALRDSLSMERQVTGDCPPVFLVACEDDRVVDHRNAMLLDSALTAHSVSHLFCHYATGGHGFGASDGHGSPESRQWKAAFLEWVGKVKKLKG